MTAIDRGAINGGIEGTYTETDGERRVTFERAVGVEGGRGESGTAESIVVAQPLAGYGMVTVRDGTGRELERYYGFDMALDHAAERLGVAAGSLPVPDAATDMGM